MHTPLHFCNTLPHLKDVYRKNEQNPSTQFREIVSHPAVSGLHRCTYHGVGTCFASENCLEKGSYRGNFSFLYICVRERKREKERERERKSLGICKYVSPPVCICITQWIYSVCSFSSSKKMQFDAIDSTVSPAARANCTHSKGVTPVPQMRHWAHN